MAPLSVSRALGLALALVILIGGARNTYYNGQDFAVMWEAGRHWILGEPLYSVARDGAMSFKYPPWVAWFFVPWAWLPLASAKVAWGIFQGLSALAVAGWCLKLGGARAAGVSLGFLALWGVWMSHTLDGQIALPMLAAALWASKKRETFAGLFVAGLALSVKALSGLPWVWLALEGGRAGRFVRAAGVALALALLGAVVLGGAGESISGWVETAGSGAREFSPEKVRGVENSGFTPRLAAWLGLPAESGRADALLGLALGLLLSGLWWSRSRGRSFSVRWAGWLALVPTYHPLPWAHLFVFAWPALALGFPNDSGAGGAARRKALWGLGAALIALSTPKIPLFGELLALGAGRSFGVLLILAALVCDGKSR